MMAREQQKAVLLATIAGRQAAFHGLPANGKWIEARLATAEPGR